MYTIDEVANKLSISKVTVYAKLKIFEDKVLIKQGKKYIDEELFNLIKNSLKTKTNFTDNENEDNNPVNETAATSTQDEDLININKDLINVLIKQLEEKDTTIRELLTLNKNSQILLKQEQDKDIKLLEQHFKEVDLKLMDLKENLQVKTKNKFSLKNIFKR